MELKIGSSYKFLFDKWQIKLASEYVEPGKKSIGLVPPSGIRPQVLYIEKDDIFLLLDYKSRPVNYTGYDLIEHTLTILMDEQRYVLFANLNDIINKLGIEELFELVC